MVKALKTKRFLTATLALLLGFLLAASFLTAFPVARAADETSIFTDFPTTAVTDISNRQFDDSGSYPVSPSGWTLSGLDGANIGNTKSGVIALDSSYATTTAKTGKEKLGLYKYPEYESAAPQTPFGTGEYPGTNKKVLMINTDGSTTAVGYTSASMTLAANSYYSVSVWVKTGNFAEGTGASIRLSGVETLEDDGSYREAAYHNINTVGDLEELNAANKYGFRQYKFYVATASKSVTASLVLSVGAKATDEAKDINYYYPAKGYAFFDNVEVYRLSPMTFRHETDALRYDDKIADTDSTPVPYLRKAGNTAVANLDRSRSFIEINGDFTDIVNGMPKDWTRVVPEEGNSGVATAGAYNATQMFDKEGARFHLSADPVSPNGKDLDYRDTQQIFVISSYNEATERDNDVAAAYRSVDFTVKRYAYARIGFWAKTQDVSGGSAAVAVVGENILNDSDDETLDVSQTVTGDADNASRYGWKYYEFYIKGSVLQDYQAHLELRLGTMDSKARGVAMFADIRYEDITYSEYTANESTDNVVTFDGTFPDSGITNGNFMTVGDYETEKGTLVYPLTPAEWTEGDPTTVASGAGFSMTPVESSKDAKIGIVPTDAEGFDKIREQINYASNPTLGNERGNMLFIGSTEETAVYLASPSLTVTSGTDYTLTVSLCTQNIEGYGANIVLKNSEGAVLSTVEGIKTTGGIFKDYTFYIEGGTADQTVSVEIWLGLNDRKNNATKLASGNLFVKKASFTSIEDTAELPAKADAYVAAVKNGSVRDLSYSFYSFENENLTAFDVYDDGVVKTAYNWTLAGGDGVGVKYGIFNAARLPQNQSEIPSSFRNGDADNAAVLYLHNTSANFTRLSSRTVYNLAENTYHKVTVQLKVDIPQAFLDNGTAIGAGIELSGTEYAFKDIRTTALVADANNPDGAVDTEYYRTFTFYIKADRAADVSVSITLGGNTFTNEHTAGRVYVNKIDVQEINNTEYEMVTEDAYNKLTVLESATDSDDDSGDETETPSNNSIQWWLIPSILFAVAIVIAVVGFVVRRIIEKRSNRKTTEKMNSYDRRATLNKQHNQTAKAEEKVAAPETPIDDTTYDTFDDEATAKAKPAKAEPVDVAETSEPAETTEETASAETESMTESNEATEEQPVENATETKPESAETTEPAEKPATPAEPAEKPAEPQKPDAYTDSFDD